MKKRYSRPETMCIDIKMQQLMAGSLSGTSGADGLGVVNNSEGITEGASRRNNFWDDEE